MKVSTDSLAHASIWDVLDSAWSTARLTGLGLWRRDRLGTCIPKNIRNMGIDIAKKTVAKCRDTELHIILSYLMSQQDSSYDSVTFSESWE